MSIYRTIVCDRCGAEERMTHHTPDGWREEASIVLTGVAPAYAGHNVKWNGSLCLKCSDYLHEQVSALVLPFDRSAE